MMGMETRLDWDTATRRVGVLSGQVARLHAELVETAAQVIADEAWMGAGVRSVNHFLELQTGLDRHTVGKIVTVASRAGELPDVLDLVRQGRLTLDQAAVVARHVPAGYGASVAEFAEYATVTQLQRALGRYAFDTEPETEPVATLPEARVSMTTADERFRLTFTTSDLVAGNLIEQAIREAKYALFTAGAAEATLADGLIEVAHRSLASITEPSRRDRYRVVVHVDTDGQSWLQARGALPKHLASRYTCDGQIAPVWQTDSTPVAVGRSQRIVPDRTRRLIEDRDKGCRYPGCHSRGYLEVHHKTHWRDGGTTDPENLLCLCSFHHDQHHRGEYQIHGNPQNADGLVFHSHRGWQINPKRPAPPPAPELPPPNWRGPTGEHLHTRWLTLHAHG